MTIYPTVSTTGHRGLSDTRLAWLRPELDRVLAKLRDEHGTADAHTGMALDSDQEFGWAALRAKLTLHAHIPFPDQPDRWPPDRQHEYRWLLAECADDRKVYGPAYDAGLLFARNDGLLRVADVLVAVWDGRRTGGTHDTVRKAARRGLPVIHLDVSRLETHGPGCSCVANLTAPGLL